MGNIQIMGTFFVALIGADCNELIKSHDSPAFIKCGWGIDGNLWMFRDGGGGYQNQTSADKVGGGVQSLVIL